LKRTHLTIVLGLALALAPAALAAKKPAQKADGPITVAMLEGGRKVEFVRMLSSEQELHTKRGFFNRALDIIAGAPEWHHLVRPYAVTTDSKGRLIISDPGALVVHIFDFEKSKYTAIEGGKRDTFKSPIGVAVDGEDNIYVTDSQLGKIFVFDARGKSRRVLGDIKGEGFYKRPTGIAIDKTAKRIYVTDTLRNRVYITDMDGNVQKYFGDRGDGKAEFNFPTEVFLQRDEVYVVDAMNFRVQVFDKDGNYKSQFGKLGDATGTLFRPKGLGVDSEGDVYLVDASLEAIQVFNREGTLLYNFGRSGGGIAQFSLPSGIWIDGKDRIFVADSYNRRIQIFQYTPAQRASNEKR
jgi:DNA-binding beta-propeller fold protein YncE